MEFLSRFRLKRTERELVACLRLIRGALCSYSDATCSSQLNDEATRVFAAHFEDLLKREDIRHTLKQAEKIVHEYAASILSEISTSRSIIAADRLPYPKKLIKLALILWLHLETDQKQREVLKSGYLGLADWQEGVGNEPVGLDMTKIDLNADPLELAKQVIGPLTVVVKWNAVSGEEMGALKSELQQWGLW